jgi:hypothetical protein
MFAQCRSTETFREMYEWKGTKKDRWLRSVLWFVKELVDMVFVIHIVRDFVECCYPTPSVVVLADKIIYHMKVTENIFRPLMACPGPHECVDICIACSVSL